MEPRALVSRRGLLGASALGLAASAGLAGCAGADAPEGSAPGSDGAARNQVTIAMSTSNEPAAGFDPCIDWGCGEHVHEPLIQSTLVVTTKDMAFENDLAVSYECSADNLVWTFEIRDDACFSDGEPLTASDVAFTINTIRTSPQAQADLTMVTDAVAVSDTVVEIHLSKPWNALLYTLAVMGIVPEHAYGEDYGAHPIGSGRYLLKQWDKGQQVIFEANPRYYGEAPAIERFCVVFMEEDAALAAAKGGKVDMAYTSATFADQQVDGFALASYASVDSRGINLPVIPSGATRLLEGDMAYEAGNDVTCRLAVRRAINLGIDRTAMIEHTLGSHGTPAYSIGDGMPWASADMKVETDVAAAERLLDEDGWAVGEDGVRVREGVRAALTLWYPAGDTVRQAMANDFAEQMRGLGIEVTPSGASWDEIYLHQFCDPVMWGWGSNAPTDIYEINHSAGMMNYACYENPVTDAYLDQALAQEDVEASYPLWHKAQWDGEEGIAPQGAATWAWFANVDHLYWVREGLEVAEQKLQPHGHGWSVVNNIDAWRWK